MQKSYYLNAPISGFRRWMVCFLVLSGLWTTNSFGQINVVSGGAGLAASYTSFTNAGGLFAALNGTSQAGQTIVISIVGDVVTEAGTNALTGAAGMWTSLTISPSGARTISGAPAASTPLINFNGADNVTINGLNSGGNTLTLSNTTIGTTAGTATIQFIADATNNVITNCTVLGSSTSAIATGGGTIAFRTATTTGNDNNTISNCNIGPAGANLPSKGIVGVGTGTTTTTCNSGIIINNNNIFDFFLPGGNCAGIFVSTGNDTWTISNNRLYQTATRTFTTTALRYSAIGLSGSTTVGSVFTVTGNTIGFGAANGTGTTTITGSSNEVRGIDAPAVNSTTPTSIQGNIISGINQTTTRASTTAGNSPFIGITVGVTNGLYNIGTTTGNTIGSLDGSSTIVINATSTTANNAPVMGIFDNAFFSNTISNNNIGAITIQSTGTTVGFRGIFASITTGLTTTMNNNTIGGTNAGGAITDLQVGSYAMYGLQCSSANLIATGNTIRNMSGASNGAALIVSAGIIAGTGATGVSTLSQNTIHTLSNASGAASNSVYGIFGNFPATANIVERNFMHSFSMTSTVTTGTVVGIAAAGGNAEYKNNMVRLGIDATGSSITTGFQFVGIFDITGAGSNNFYHNSVYIGGSGVGTGSSTFAFASSVTTNARIYRDNIFYNARSNGAGAGKHYAVNVAGTAPNPAGLTINNNLYYANGTGGVFGLFNAADVANLTAWKIAVGQDAGSFEGDPQYQTPGGTSATVDLHINPAIATLAEGNGAGIGSVTNDFDGQIRSTLTPVDIGADAGNFTSAGDLSAPSITYTALAFTCSTGDRVLSATITDASGVPAQGSGTEPRIYYRKNAGAYFSQPGTLASGSVTNGVWDFTIVAADMGGIAAGDVIGYYVVAQDILGNISSNPSGVTSGTVNSHTAPSPNTYSINSSLGGSYTVGAGQNYTTLTAAVAAYNVSCLTGPVTFLLMDLNYNGGTGETFPININSNPDASAINTLTIKPNATGTTISGSSATGIIMMNGSDYVIIDGSTGATANTVCPPSAASRDLTITNTNAVTTAAVVWLGTTAGLNAVTNCTVKNCIISGASPSTTNVGLGAGGTTIGTGGTSNNDISFVNNDVRACQFAIYSSGASSAVKNQNLTVNQNTINTASPNNILQAGIYVAYTNNPTVSGNNIGNVISATSSIDPIGINLGFGAVNGLSATTTGLADGITNATITKNVIGVIQQSVTYSAAGIALGNTISGTSLIANNMISGVAANGTSGDFSAGIIIGGGAGAVNVYYNTVSMQGTIVGATGASQSAACLAYTSSSAPTALDLRNNIFSNTQVGNAGATVKFEAIALGYSSTVGNYAGLTSNNNDLYCAGAGPGTYQVGITGGVVSGTVRTTLVNWQTETGRDGVSKNVAPSFVSSTNLHLTTGGNTQLDNTGTAVSVMDDIDCTTRTGPDIGADEFTGCTVTANINPSNPSICSGGSQNLSENAGFATAWSWSTGATTQSISVSPGTTTTYTVTITSGACTASASTIVTVNATPTGVIASASDNSVCDGGSVDLFSSADAPSPTILSQDWESGMGSWTAVNNTTGGTPANTPWTLRPHGYVSTNSTPVTFNSPGGSQFILSNADLGGSGTSVNTVLTSPAFSTIGYSAASLSFRHYYRLFTSLEANVEVSTNGTSWTTIKSYTADQGTSTGFVTDNISLNAYVGFPSVKVRFRYQDGWSWYWAVDDISVTGTPTAYGYSWVSSPAGFTSSQQNPTGVTPTATTDYTVTVTGLGGCTATASTTVTLNARPTAALSGSTAICNGGNTNLSVAVTGAGTISGTINPGGIPFSGTAGTITVNVAPASTTTYTLALPLTDDNCTAIAGDLTGSAIVTVNARPTGALSGTTTICPGGTATLSIAATGSGTISGTLSPGAIPYSGTAPTITVNVSPAVMTSYTISTMADANCTSDPGDLSGGATVSIYTTATAPTSVTSDDANNEICVGQQIMLTANGGAFGNAPGSTYKWYEGGCGTGPALGSSSTLSVTPTAGTHTYYVRIEDACGNSSCASLVVLVSSGPPSNSVGTPVTPSEACNGTVSLVSVNSVGGPNVKYSWNTGSNSSVVLFSNNIGGPFSPGPFQTTINQVYAQFGALAGSSGYNICVQGVNACGSTNNKCDWIRGVVSVPGTITPPSGVVACPNDVKNYSCGASGGATVYNWTLGGSATPITSGQGTTNVSVTFPPAFTSAQLCVTAALSCGGSSTSAPRCMTISKNPAVPGAFTAGPSSVCPGATGVVYTVPAVTGAAGYSWTTPAGTTITSGQNTTSITVNFPNPYTGAPPVCVSATSACGSSAARCKAVGSNLPGQPGAMAGPTTNVCNSTVQYSISNVANATSYTWTNPAGTTITSGQTTTTILLSVSPSFVSGQLTVVANTNACTPGTSIPRTITINGKPNVPGTITANPAIWCTGGFVNFSVTPVSPLPTYNWSVSNGTITAGQGSNNIDVTWGATAAGSVTVNASNGCGASSNRVQSFSAGCREESFGYAQDDLYSVYPNPAHDKVTVSIDVKESTTLSLQLMDVSGRTVLSESQAATAGMNTYDLDLTYLSKGVYMLEVKSATDNWKTKVVVE